jgi:hypothetical protein
MSIHRYHRRDLNADLLRTGLGIAACVIPIFYIGPDTPAAYVLAGFAGFFALFGLRTLLQTRTVATLDGSGVSISGWTARRIPWDKLDAMKLSYFSTRRDREAGWMQLKMYGNGTRIAVHSTLEGFEEVCRHAVRAAQDNDIEISHATARNLAVIGLGEHAQPEQSAKTPAALSGWGNPADWRR